MLVIYLIVESVKAAQEISESFCFCHYERLKHYISP